MRHAHPPFALSPELRIKMLQAMCSGDNKMKVCDKEIRTIEARTLPTLKSFKGEYDFLNNRYECSFVWNGVKFNNAESAFYASKSTNDEEIRLFSRMTVY